MYKRSWSWIKQTLCEHFSVGVFAASEQPNNHLPGGTNNHIKLQILCNRSETEVETSVFLQERQLDYKPRLAGGQLDVQMPLE